MNLLNYQRI